MLMLVFPNAEINRLPPTRQCVGFETETSITEYLLVDGDMYRVSSDMKLTPLPRSGDAP